MGTSSAVAAAAVKKEEEGRDFYTCNATVYALFFFHFTIPKKSSTEGDSFYALFSSLLLLCF